MCPSSATKDSGIATRGPPPLSGSALSAGNRPAINMLAGEGSVQYSRANWKPVFFFFGHSDPARSCLLETSGSQQALRPNWIANKRHSTKFSVAVTLEVLGQMRQHR